MREQEGKKNKRGVPVNPLRVEFMDTTLRDGEQTQGVALTPEEKLTLARTLIEKIGVNRIEVASARVSTGEGKSLRQITSWARTRGALERIEVLGFCDLNKSADWIAEAGGHVMNLLVKGSLKHLQNQLKKTPSQHVNDITKTVEYCAQVGISCNCYLEDWSNGMQEKENYAKWLVGEIGRRQIPIQRIMLADTLGILSPSQVGQFVEQLVAEFPNTWFDFHAHNDYGLATANTLAAVGAGAKGVHVTINGLGERAGNAPLDEVAVALRDFGGVAHTINEKNLSSCAKIVEVFSGRRLASNKPITGQSVFTQTAGIHADGDKKGDLYISRLTPERFGRKRTYALGKLAGKASLEMNLSKLGLDLTQEQRQMVLKRIVELGDQKHVISLEDLPFVISDVLKTPQKKIVEITECDVTTTKSLSKARIKIKYRDQETHASAIGDGGYDAFMKALDQTLQKFKIRAPHLIDYEVHIPPGGSTGALVETNITWGNDLRTRGVDTDQVRAAISATEKMLNIILGGVDIKKGNDHLSATNLVSWQMHKNS